LSKAWNLTLSHFLSANDFLRGDVILWLVVFGIIRNERYIELWEALTLGVSIIGITFKKKHKTWLFRFLVCVKIYSN
jgi:hypothetical protein